MPAELRAIALAAPAVPFLLRHDPESPKPDAIHRKLFIFRRRGRHSIRRPFFAVSIKIVVSTILYYETFTKTTEQIRNLLRSAVTRTRRYLCSV